MQQEKKESKVMEERESSSPGSNIPSLSTKNSPAFETDAPSDSGTETSEPPQSSQKREYPRREKVFEELGTSVTAPRDSEETFQRGIPTSETLKADPSILASILLGIAPSREQSNAVENIDVVPYLRNPSVHGRNPFAELSPDDIVQRAQAKGPKTGK